RAQSVLYEISITSSKLVPHLPPSSTRETQNLQVFCSAPKLSRTSHPSCSHSSARVYDESVIFHIQHLEARLGFLAHIPSSRQRWFILVYNSHLGIGTKHDSDKANKMPPSVSRLAPKIRSFCQ